MDFSISLYNLFLLIKVGCFPTSYSLSFFVIDWLLDFEKEDDDVRENVTPSANTETNWNMKLKWTETGNSFPAYKMMELY